MRVVLACLLLSACDVTPFDLNSNGGDDGGVLFDDAGNPIFIDAGANGDGGVPFDAVGVDACIGFPETCDGADNDCDGNIDEDFDFDLDPANCGGCGTTCSLPNMAGTCNVGDCEYSCLAGFLDLNMDIQMDGCEYACLPSNNGVEACDFTDNDCDGLTDEDFNLLDDEDNCGGCGVPCLVLNAVPECTMGMCGFSDCDDGFEDVIPEVPGCEYTCPENPPSAETCDNVDNDCNGIVDDGNIANVGDDCTDPGFEMIADTGECAFGAIECSFGIEVCSNYVAPITETCNDLDDDCDGTPDEDFDKLNDPRYCGGCTACDLDEAIAGCSVGMCTIVACLPGFVDSDGDPGNGCEYACTPSGPEVCDGIDNDCDELFDTDDPDLAIPGNLCSDLGECGTVSATCGIPPCETQTQWYCDYSVTSAELDSCGQVLIEETICDDNDGDCDGAVDESFTTLGDTCVDANDGICQGSGDLICNVAGDDVTCDITTPGQMATSEVCNNLDDDCNGMVDDGAPDDWTFIDDGMGTTFWMYTYEASRPDATDAEFGVADHRSCSQPSVFPWRNATWVDANQACIDAGHRLCTETEWQLACEGLAGNRYPYGNPYQADFCNGHDYDHDCTGDNEDFCLPTGLDFGCPAPGTSQCVSEFGVIDMSGNLKEWTSTQVSFGPDTFRIRGGSFDNVRQGLTCDFDFVSAEDDFFFTNLGFRCCSDTGP
jgi:hypothetical protein